nr:hypothetical protein [Tanacetum cinerariifolium]
AALHLVAGFGAERLVAAVARGKADVLGLEWPEASAVAGKAVHVVAEGIEARGVVHRIDVVNEKLRQRPADVLRRVLDFVGRVIKVKLQRHYALAHRAIACYAGYQLLAGLKHGAFLIRVEADVVGAHHHFVF